MGPSYSPISWEAVAGQDAPDHKAEALSAAGAKFSRQAKLSNPRRVSLTDTTPFGEEVDNRIVWLVDAQVEVDQDGVAPVPITLALDEADQELLVAFTAPWDLWPVRHPLAGEGPAADQQRLIAAEVLPAAGAQFAMGLDDAVNVLASEMDLSAPSQIVVRPRVLHQVSSGIPGSIDRGAVDQWAPHWIVHALGGVFQRAAASPGEYSTTYIFVLSDDSPGTGRSLLLP